LSIFNILPTPAAAEKLKAFFLGFIAMGLSRCQLSKQGGSKFKLEKKLHTPVYGVKIYNSVCLSSI
jgi:hypothetical protein